MSTVSNEVAAYRVLFISQMSQTHKWMPPLLFVCYIAACTGMRTSSELVRATFVGPVFKVVDSFKREHFIYVFQLKFNLTFRCFMFYIFLYSVGAFILYSPWSSSSSWTIFNACKSSSGICGDKRRTCVQFISSTALQPTQYQFSLGGSSDSIYGWFPPSVDPKFPSNCLCIYVFRRVAGCAQLLNSFAQLPRNLVRSTSRARSSPLLCDPRCSAKTNRISAANSYAFAC